MNLAGDNLTVFLRPKGTSAQRSHRFKRWFQTGEIRQFNTFDSPSGQ
jgi:predicted metalloprotease